MAKTIEVIENEIRSLSADDRMHLLRDLMADLDGSMDEDDEEHSKKEDRFIMLGMSLQSRILVVCHCERKSGEVIRIISARKATKSERKYYPG